MAASNFRIIIVGAGVSGLTTALALHRLGLRADIYERKSTIADLGAGIAIVLIGADGIRSFARSLYNQDVPIFTDQVVVRNIIKAEVLHSKLKDCLVHGQVWLAPEKRHVVAFPIERGESIAIGAILPALPGYEWKETWKIQGHVNFHESLAKFDAPVRDLFQYSESQTVFGLYERSPLTSWTNGKIVLVGDAAHAMLPYQGQGGSQAIEDGIVLALTLAAAAKSPPTKLQQWLQCYQDARKPRADQAARASHITGKAFHDLMFSDEGMEFLKNAYSWINENDLLNDLRLIVEQKGELSGHQSLITELMGIFK
ncbi:hypothetical protein HJFPF1_08556 [Paramyrothecium foliicola]|nr:hypothetical protein HJFPF1_08556 [Paramyrothecium foliicola]